MKKSIYSLLILVLLCLITSCQKLFDPNEKTPVFRLSQIVGTWKGSKNPNELIINTTKDVFQYGNFSSSDMPEDFSAKKNKDTEEYSFGFSYAERDTSGSIPVIRDYNVKITFKNDYECTVEDSKYDGTKDTFRRVSREQNATFIVNSLGPHAWRCKDNFRDEIRISYDGGIYYGRLIDYKIPNYDNRRVDELSIETTEGTFRFVSISRCLFNNKTYIISE